MKEQLDLNFEEKKEEGKERERVNPRDIETVEQAMEFLKMDSYRHKEYEGMGEAELREEAARLLKRLKSDIRTHEEGYHPGRDRYRD